MGKYDNLAAMADEAGDAVRQTIRAYHGSPHDFDRFDASKLGTGEGNQVSPEDKAHGLQKSAIPGTKRLLAGH